MYYYIVPKIGTGLSRSNAFRPDVEGDFVGQVGLDDKYIVATAILQSPKQGRILLPPLQILKDACSARGIDFDDVMKWFVGGG